MTLTMKSIRYSLSIIITGSILLLGSCNRDKRSSSEKAGVEVLPVDIVELRDDQIKLAGIETGSVEIRSASRLIQPRRLSKEII